MPDLSYHPANLFLRFLLELTALICSALWAYQLSNSSILIAILAPLLLAVIWGVFAVPGDRSRSGKTIVATKGSIRLIIEFLVFGFGAFCLFKTQYYFFFFAFMFLVLVHYSISIDRIKWLLNAKK